MIKDYNKVINKHVRGLTGTYWAEEYIEDEITPTPVILQVLLLSMAKWKLIGRGIWGKLDSHSGTCALCFVYNNKCHRGGGKVSPLYRGCQLLCRIS